MAEDTCAVDDCAKPSKALGWCAMHYSRQHKYGDLGYTALPVRGIPAVERIPYYVNADGDCWEWNGARDPAGYGQLTYRKRSWKAHRWVWTTLVGPIPEGLTIDHLCRNPGCVNPDHLEPVTQQVNTLRGYGMGGRHARKTHCHRGHPFNDENTYVFPDGRRDCRTCRAASRRRWKQRQTT